MAAAITNNTSTYGATGANSIALGYQAKATTSKSIAIGAETVASGFDNSICIGWQSSALSGRSAAVLGGRDNTSSGAYSTVVGGQSNTASADHSVAMGYNSTASHANSFALGDTASTSAANQITLGSTSDTVRISSAYTLPTSDGTANQVLTTDGSGAVTFSNVASSITSSDLDMNGNKVLFANVYSALGDLPSASTYHGMFAHVHATGKGYYAHGGNWIELANDDLPGGATGVDFNDNVKARFGTGNDLEIYHDSTTNHSYIKESNSSGLEYPRPRDKL